MSDAAASPQPLSKREMKRQQKLAKERALDVASPQEKSTAVPASPVQDSIDGSTDSRPSPFLEPVQKRIRNYLKKKQKIDKLTEQSQDKSEAAKLNADQLDILARKDQVLAPLKELQALADQFTGIDLDHARQLKAEASDRQKQHQSSVAEAKQAGYEEGKKLVESLVGFLGYASVLRINPTDDQEYNEATERLLSMFYEGGSVSIDAAESLKQGSDECIEGTDVSFARVAGAMRPVPPSPEDAQPVIPESVTEDADAETTVGAVGHLVSFGEVAQHATMTTGVGISFLNESEIEGTHAPEEPDTSEPVNGLDTPAQGIAETFDANQAGIAWNAESPEINWADEPEASEPEQAQVQKSIPAVASVASVAKPAPVLSKPATDEFTQVEARKRDSGGRGRGRGDRRDRGRGRGSRGRPAVSQAI